MMHVTFGRDDETQMHMTLGLAIDFSVATSAQCPPRDSLKSLPTWLVSEKQPTELTQVLPKQSLTPPKERRLMQRKKDIRLVGREKPGARFAEPKDYDA